MVAATVGSAFRARLLFGVEILERLFVQLKLLLLGGAFALFFLMSVIGNSSLVVVLEDSH